MGVSLFVAMKVPAVPAELIAYGRRIMINIGRSKILYTGEGINSSIAISRWDDGAIQFHVSGKVEASTESYDMRLQRLLGHMPALFHNDPKSVLIVGFGAVYATTVTYLVPVVAVALGIAFRGETLHWYDIAGAALVLAGVAVSQGMLRRRRTSSADAERSQMVD